MQTLRWVNPPLECLFVTGALIFFFEGGVQAELKHPFLLGHFGIENNRK